MAMRSDNGPPFASMAAAGLMKLSVWWLQLGIRLERIEPGEPQQNGGLERHREAGPSSLLGLAPVGLSQQGKNFRLQLPSSAASRIRAAPYSSGDISPYTSNSFSTSNARFRNFAEG